MEDIQFHCQPGTLTGIIGRNGAGKSTLIKILSGLLPEYEGVIKYQEKLLKNIPPNELALQRSVLSQEIPVSFNLSVLDILLMGRYPHGKLGEKDFKYVDKIIDKLNLRELLDTPYPRLSGGERQKIQFARSLCQLFPLESSANKVLFLDEPLAALDLSVQQEILKIITELAKYHETTVIMVLHDLNLIAQYCDTTYLLKDGQCHIKGLPKEVLTETNLKLYFGVDAHVMPLDNDKIHIILN